MTLYEMVWAVAFVAELPEATQAVKALAEGGNGFASKHGPNGCFVLPGGKQLTLEQAADDAAAELAHSAAKRAVAAWDRSGGVDSKQ